MSVRTALIALAALMSAAALGAQERGRVVGVVIANETTAPLAYSIISSEALGVTFFADVHPDRHRPVGENPHLRREWGATCRAYRSSGTYWESRR